MGIVNDPAYVCPVANPPAATADPLCKAYSCVYNSNLKNSDRDLLNARLDLDTRKKLLRLLAQGSLTSGWLPVGCAASADGEGTVLSLLKSTSQNDQKAILDYIYGAQVSNSYSPLQAFITNLDGANFDALMSLLTSWVTTYYPSQESWASILQRQDRSQREVLLLGNFSDGYKLETTSGAGKTLFTFKITVNLSTPQKVYERSGVAAFDYLVVKFAKDYSIGSQTFQAGGVYKLPAVLVYQLMNAMKRQARLDVAKYATYGVFAALGVGQILGAQTGLEATLALLDMGVFSSDIVINETLATKLNQTPDGKAFLDAYNKFALIYGGARVYDAPLGLSKQFRRSATVLNDPEVNDLATELSAETIEAGGLLDNAFLEGWTKERILAIPKPDRPNVDVYMNPIHKAIQLRKFNTEGGAFVIRKRDIISNPKYTTIVDRKFVGLKSEMDNVITKYKNTGQDTKVLIEELDLGDDYFKPGDEVFYVTVKPNHGFNFDLPTGNERGAYEELWIPGGFTGHGTAEAVLSNSGGYVHNNDWQTFVNFFGSENVIKIK